MPRPIHATVAASAIAHNLAVVRRQISAFESDRATRIWAVIKANAYGHGIERVLPGVNRADGLAMLDIDEAVRCREAGWGGPILMLEGIFEPADIALFERYRLTGILHHDEQFRMLRAARPGHPLDVFLKLNSGMNRLGFAPGRYHSAFEQAGLLRQQGLLGHVGHMMHFANGDQPAAVAQAMDIFERATLDMPGLRNVCNSAAALGSPQLAARTDWIRPGICLYGATPFEDGPSAAELGLLPAMALRSKLIAEQSLLPGAAVGYGGTFVCDAPMRVGIVACGYADGYPRHAPTGTPVVVQGVRTRLVGRVSMDMLAVDLTPVPQAHAGAPVTLWGADSLSVDEVATAAGTIGYELLTAVAGRVSMRCE